MNTKQILALFFAFTVVHRSESMDSGDKDGIRGKPMHSRPQAVSRSKIRAAMVGVCKATIPNGKNTEPEQSDVKKLGENNFYIKIVGAVMVPVPVYRTKNKSDVPSSSSQSSDTGATQRIRRSEGERKSEADSEDDGGKPYKNALQITLDVGLSPEYKRLVHWRDIQNTLFDALVVSGAGGVLPLIAMKKAKDYPAYWRERLEQHGLKVVVVSMASFCLFGIGYKKVRKKVDDIAVKELGSCAVYRDKDEAALAHKTFSNAQGGRVSYESPQFWKLKFDSEASGDKIKDDPSFEPGNPEYEDTIFLSYDEQFTGDQADMMTVIKDWLYSVLRFRRV